MRRSRIIDVSRRTRPLFLGLLQVTWAVAGGLGPVLGGAFTQLLSWRWIFWINLPISGAAFCLLLLFLDVHNPKTKFAEGVKAIDWAGSLSIVNIMVMVLLGLNFGGTAYPWGSPKVICLVVIGALMAVVFLFNESRLARYPIMPLGLFRHKSKAACLAIGFTQQFVCMLEYRGQNDSLVLTNGDVGRQCYRLLPPTIFSIRERGFRTPFWSPPPSTHHH